MSVFRLYIRTDNAAFCNDETGEPEPSFELARLRDVADKVERGEDISHYRTIFDLNGNDVGRFALKDEAL